MNDLEVKRITMEELEAAPGLSLLLSEYAAESAIPEIGPHNPQFQTYHAMEATGMLHVIGAYAGGQLVGFLLLMTPILPHFGARVGVTESFFVAAEFRKTGAGTALRAAAEKAALEAGAAGILMSAPSGGQLSQVLPHVGYRETNQTFFKALA